ncbi:hypothetical protein MF672_040590 [Actinomadura sp. ATCC 31491]|uniref:Tetratricopeptide repeat protein n=1 Tax=Actinomadura luzonensis TaxID=2805427 RepID=A0ABT0G614_9ACTN|nr:tetratricopeptide repeat protein [Actinomadura luzonensis]MCK2220052.1 hypothetical protein [Actinomadura luzonensis]
MASEQLDAAMDCWKAGELDRAAALFRQIAATGDPEASHLLAGLLQEQGDLDGAEAAHRAVIQSGDPVFGQRSAMAMGMMLIAAKEWAAAHRVLTIASDGADFEVAALADTSLVLVCTQLGDAPGAEEALERARRCDSAAVAELAARLELPDFDQDPATARARYAAAEDADDLRDLLTCGDPEIVTLSAFRLYRLHAEAGEYEEARAACEHAIAVGHPDHLSMAHNLLGAVLVDLGEYAESAAAYRVAAEDPRPGVRLPSLIELAKVTAQLGDEDETEAVLRRVVATGHPEYAVQAQACLAQMLAETGDAAGALDAARAVLEAGESEWAAFCVTLLGTLLDRETGAYEEIMELARLAADHPDPDAAFKARLLLDHGERRRPLADPVAEQAVQDVDAALARLRAGDLDGARELLRGAADSGAGRQAVRAMVALAELELGEGDREQADELLAYVAEGDDLVQGFAAAFLLTLLRASEDGEPHPVLRAVVDHQRLGREEGLARYRAVAGHPDPDVAAVGSAVLAQVLASFGFPLSDTSRLVDRAVGAGSPLALSYAAALARELLPDREEVVELLRRARAEGDPALAPWVGYQLGVLVEEDDPGEARAAYAAALDAPHRGLRSEAAGSLAALYERQGDLIAAARLHERALAREDGEAAARGAWLLGLTRMRLDDPEGARAAFAQARDPRPTPPPGPGAATAGSTGGRIATLGRFARRLLDGDHAAARAALAELREGGDTLLAGMLALETAHCRQRRGDHAAAGAALTLVAEAGHPGLRQEAHCYLGALREETGDAEGALAAWDRAAAGEDPATAVVALNDRARVLARLGRHAEAADACRRALALDDERHPGTVARLADALVATGDPESARDLLTETFGPAEARLRLATALHTHGDPLSALATLNADPGIPAGPAHHATRPTTGRRPAEGPVGEELSSVTGPLAQGPLPTGAPTGEGLLPTGGPVGDGPLPAGAAMGEGPLPLGRPVGDGPLPAGAAMGEGPLPLGRPGGEGPLPVRGPVGAQLPPAGRSAGTEPRPTVGPVPPPAGEPAGDGPLPGRGVTTGESLAGGGSAGAEARLLGEVLARVGEAAGARAAFERAVLADPVTAPRTLLTAARLAAEAGDTAYAHAAWERAAEQDGDPWAAAVARTRLGTAAAEERGWVLAADGDRPGALTALAEVVGSPALAELVLALDDGDAPAARRLLAALTGDDRRDGLFHTLRAARDTGDGTTARRLYRLVIELGDPEAVAEAYLSMGASWAEDGHPGRAELCLLPATEHPATAHAAWHDLAIVRRRRGDLDGSLEALRAGMPRTAAALADALAERGDAPGVRRALADGAAAGDLECLRLLVAHLVAGRDPRPPRRRPSARWPPATRRRSPWGTAAGATPAGTRATCPARPSCTGRGSRAVSPRWCPSCGRAWPRSCTTWATGRARTSRRRRPSRPGSRRWRRPRICWSAAGGTARATRSGRPRRSPPPRAPATALRRRRRWGSCGRWRGRRPGAAPTTTPCGCSTSSARKPPSWPVSWARSATTRPPSGRTSRAPRGARSPSCRPPTG